MNSQATTIRDYGNGTMIDTSQIDKKEPYKGCDIPHTCEPVFCHICEAHFMTWNNDPRPVREKN